MTDRDKFVSDLYKNYYSTIKRNAWKVTNDEGLAEDFVQEFFLHILTKLDQYDPTRGTFK